MTSSGRVIDLGERIETLGVGRLGIFAIFLCFTMMIADGYDFTTLSVSAPAIIREWKLSPKDMGGVFSITFFGLLVGSLLYGWMADHWGRKPTIVLGTFNFGLPVLATVFIDNTQALSILRFIGGIGMGGIVPIAYTLVSEYAPRRARSTVTVITNIGYSVGGILTGIIAAWLIPAYGWRVMFVIGGSVSVVMGVVLYFTLPESALFLALRNPRSPRLPGLARRLLPNETIEPGTSFIAHEEQDASAAKGAASASEMFAGMRGIATVLLWVLFVSDSLGFFFLSSWLPVLMENSGIGPSLASLSQSLFLAAGLVSAVIMMRLIDRWGPIVMIVLPILAVPTEIFMGVPHLTAVLMLSAVTVAGACLSGIHYCVYAIAVRFYPPSLRGRGVSVSTVFGRAGGIVAPYIGGYLLAAHMPMQQLMIFAALPCVVTALVGFALGRLHDQHFHTTDLTPSVPARSAVPSV